MTIARERFRHSTASTRDGQPKSSIKRRTDVRRYVYYLTLANILLYACIVQTYGLIEPWASGHLGTQGARYSLHAINFVRYGYLATGFRPILDAGWVSPDAYTLYTHHPPLISILVSLSFRLFGIHEWSARLVPITCSVVTILLIHQLARRFWSPRTALLSAAFAATMPIGAYYGQRVSDQGALLICILMLTVSFYWHYCQHSRNRYLLGVAVGVLLAILTDWQGLYIVALLICHYLVFGRRRLNWRFWLFVFVSVLMWLLLVQYIIGLDGFIEKLLHRTGSAASDTDLSQTFTMLQWARRIGSRTLHAYTLPVICLSIFWGWSELVKTVKEKQLAEDTSFVLSLLGFAGLQLFIGRQAAWIHEYRVEYFIPGLALAAGWATDRILNSLKHRTRQYRLALSAIICLLAVLAINAASVTFTRHQRHFNPETWAKFGKAIAQNTALDAEILTSARTPYQLRYYADRKLVGEIRSRSEFEIALSSCNDNCHFFFAPLDFPLYAEDPHVSIIPLDVADSQAYHELLTYLQSRYRTQTGDGYLMFHLDHPLSGHSFPIEPTAKAILPRAPTLAHHKDARLTW
jgi:4-amino-4-deoxy-L-arabinose transferase-like glycosyltransferase